ASDRDGLGQHHRWNQYETEQQPSEDKQTTKRQLRTHDWFSNPVSPKRTAGPNCRSAESTKMCFRDHTRRNAQSAMRSLLLSSPRARPATECPRLRLALVSRSESLRDGQFANGPLAEVFLDLDLQAFDAGGRCDMFQEPLADPPRDPFG